MRNIERGNRLIEAGFEYVANPKKQLYTKTENNLARRAGSLARLGHLLDVQKVTGSNPVRPTSQISLSLTSIQGAAGWYLLVLRCSSNILYT